MQLIKKQILGGRTITIYIDSKNRIKGFIEEHGVRRDAFFVKGLPKEINVSNEKLIQWLKDTLETNCYFTVTQGDIHVNLKLLGGGWRKVLGVVVGVAQIAGGAALTVGTGGVLPVLLAQV
jgi:hypothetical protein